MEVTLIERQLDGSGQPASLLPPSCPTSGIGEDRNLLTAASAHLDGRILSGIGEVYELHRDMRVASLKAARKQTAAHAPPRRAGRR